MPPVVAAAGITAAAGIGSAVIGGKAANKAAKTQAAAADAGIGEQRRQFDLTRSDLAPWLAAGNKALGGSLDLLGLNGADVQTSALSGLGQGNPLFDSLFRNGQEAILQSASATGGLRGGNIQHSLANFGSDLFGSMVDRQLGYLGGLSGLGQQTGVSLGGFGANNANAIAGLLGNRGDALASGALGRGSAFTSGIGSLADFLKTIVNPPTAIDAFGTNNSKYNSAKILSVGLPF